MSKIQNKQLQFFVKDNGRRLPVSDDYLLPFLPPTSKSTYFRDPAPEGELSERQKGRFLLQIHQILHLLNEYGFSLKGKTMLDIGTGDGLVPCMMLELSDLDSAFGSDPYLDGEFVTRWRVHDQNKALAEIKSFLEKHCRNAIDYSCYKYLLRHENHSMVPGKINFANNKSKHYRFAKIGAHELARLNQKFDFVYCKAIEHIHNWGRVFESVAAVTDADAVLYFKHRSFFSYLGAHRRGSIGIPWGHLLLTDKEYERFVKEYYPDDAQNMINFYFGGLAYPRATVSDMIKFARKHGFIPITVISEPTRHLNTVYKFADDIKDFWAIVNENYPCLGAEEVFSGMYHILFRKA